MEKKTEIINILTYKLPFDLANQIFSEYQARIKEVDYFLNNNNYYAQLKNDKSIVEILLALSIFHKRVICNLDGAVKFHTTVTKKSDTDTIRIGSYKLNIEERNNILALTITYRNLLEKFGISASIFNYLETKDFLRNLINFKKELKNDNISGKRNFEDDLPF